MSGAGASIPRVSGGGNLDFYLAVSPIFPIIFLAIVIESRLSFTSGYSEMVERVSKPDTAIALKLALQGLWLLVFFAALAAIWGEVASLHALHAGRATATDFRFASYTLGLEAAILVWLLLERALTVVLARDLWIANLFAIAIAGSSTAAFLFATGFS